MQGGPNLLHNGLDEVRKDPQKDEDQRLQERPDVEVESLPAGAHDPDDGRHNGACEGVGEALRLHHVCDEETDAHLVEAVSLLNHEI